MMFYEPKNAPAIALAQRYSLRTAEIAVIDIAEQAVSRTFKRLFKPEDGQMIATALGVGMIAQFDDPNWRKSPWFTPLWGRLRLGLSDAQADVLDRWWSGFRRALDYATEKGIIDPADRQQWLDEMQAAMFDVPTNPLKEIADHGA